VDCRVASLLATTDQMETILLLTWCRVRARRHAGAEITIRSSSFESAEARFIPLFAGALAPVQGRMEMKKATIARASIAIALAIAALPANAAVLVFAGDLSGAAVAGPDASCAPLPFRGTIAPAASIGNSSLGDFAYSHNICLSGANGPSQGVFTVDFGIDRFQGTLNGIASPTGTTGIANIIFNYTVLGGTGRFLGASGAFVGTGFNDARTRPAQLSLAIDGSINAPAVPEPGTWGMMLLGFGALGLALRRRRAAPQLAPASS
jgi:hypothetical protein